MKLEYFLAGLGCGFILTASFVIVDTARHHKPSEVREATYAPPDIPDCPKELWDRVRGECSE